MEESSMCRKTVELNNIIVAKEEFNDRWVIGEVEQDGIGYKWKKYISEDIIHEIWRESPHKKFFDRLQIAINILDTDEV